MTPTTTVLLPVRDGAATLADSLASLVAQTDPDFEVVVVDDGSCDDTPALLAAWAARDPRFRVFRRPATGLVAALQFGLAQARGRFIARLDADDRARPRRLEAQRALLASRPDLGLVSCLVAYHPPPGPPADSPTDSPSNPGPPAADPPDRLERPSAAGLARGTPPGVGFARYVDWMNSLLTPDDIERERFVESPLAHPSVMFRRALIERYGGYRPGPFPEDYELWLRWLDAGVRMAKVPEVLLDWYDRPARLSRTDADRCRLDRLFALKAVWLARWLARHNPHHPRIMVWGASRLARRRLAPLERQGVTVTGFFDLRPTIIGRQIDGRPVFSRDRLPPPGAAFTVVYVSAHGARAEIRARAAAAGWREGVDFLFAA
ncbi:MAG: Glycosyl transferase, group 2 family protein [Candidatus Ozemobacter sibiricus]|uniref:Glycosyl transferase, group 2 family protein n=1 Tax=Candidatus Ozemobacter sibiricus TaxID=2268124 RepID=A0A367ZJJ2_9BACT|nr:MAG: Glycosyl transferase, group 2 family protein [Candidatus Ozemobacter sibiricus]